MTSHLGPRVVPYLELLRLRGEPSESVRVRVALDVLGLLTGSGATELSPRGDESPTVDRVLIAPDGSPQLLDAGDRTGAAMLVWEVLAGRALEATPPPRLHDVLDDIHPDLDDLMERAVASPSDPSTVEQLGEELAAAAQGRIATRERVMFELGLSARRSAAPPSRQRSASPTEPRSVPPPVPPSAPPPRTPTAPPPAPPSAPPPRTPTAPPLEAPTEAPTAPPPAPPSAPPPGAPTAPPPAPPSTPPPRAASAPPPRAPSAPPPEATSAALPETPTESIDDAWSTPPRETKPPPSSAPRASIRATDDTLTIEQQARAAAIRNRAMERAAFVRDGARAVVARKLAAEHAAAERAAEEAARLAEDAARAAAERAAAESKELEREAALLAEGQALREASERTAQLLTGALDVPRTVDLTVRTVLLITAPGPEQVELGRAIRAQGFALAVHHDATGALAAAHQIQPVCIVADYDLPDATGDSMARQLRKHGSELSLTPFLLLASRSETSSGRSRFALGADVCMLKPFRTDEVVAQISALVGMAARLSSARRAFPTLEPGNGRGFGGDLVQMSIAAILTVLELEHRTGTFHVMSDGRGAELEIVTGLFVRGAVSGVPMAPVGVLRVMLAWKNGRFSFEPLPPRDLPEAAQNISDVLTAAMRYERAQALHIERASDTRDARSPDSAPSALRLRPRDSKGR